MDDPLRYFSVSGNGLQELVEDCEVWDLVNQCGSPKVVDIWIIKGGVGDDSNEEGCGGSAVNCEQYDGSDDSGEEYDGSEEELTSDAVGIDDEEFDNNIDVNVEYGGLEDIEVQHQETSLAVVPCDEITYSDEGSIAGSDGNSLTTTNRIAVQELAQDQHAQSVQQGMASVEAARGIQGPSRGKQVKPPKKSSRNKLPIKRYGTRSGSFRSLFFGNDKDPINLD
nr:uncharacterized protein LOC109185271 [Ipomoea batatas]